jgi:hypothetical protein
MAGCLLALYLLVVGYLVFWPTADTPTESVSWLAGVLGALGAPEWITPRVVEFASNALLFVPITFLGSFVWPEWSWRRWLVAGLGASSLIELVQLVLLSGRSATVEDIAANTLGALAGAVLARPARAWLRLAV